MDKEELAGFVAEIRTDLKYIKKGLGKKANKWVETVMKGVVGTVLFAVLGAIIGLVLTGSTALAYTLIFK